MPTGIWKTWCGVWRICLANACSSWSRLASSHRDQDEHALARHIRQTPHHVFQMPEMVDRATRANIVINTIDARGLYTPDVGGDIADPPHDSYRTAGYKTSYRVAAQLAQQDVLAQLADGTGGNFYHNRNDVDEAMREAGAAPAISYFLGFSPQNLM